MSNIAIVGAGHVGVVYAAGLAELGHRVKVIDIDRRKVERLSKGSIWFYEPGLPELLERNVRRRRISFTTSYADGLAKASFAFICVPTPTTDDGSLEDIYLRKAFDEIRRHKGRPAPIIVNKSTVPVGTGDALAREFANELTVVSNPEFLAEGRAVDDFFRPSRVVIGSRDRAAAEQVAELYAPLRAPVVFTDPATAELSKLAANAFLATKVSFANALSQISGAVGADGEKLGQVLSLDPRIGQGHLRPGLGFGGSCLPKDLAAVENLARRYSASADLFTAVAALNRGQQSRIVDLLRARLGDLAGKRICILGASFKANTDDLRESPALALARQLQELGAEVATFDPAANGALHSMARGWLSVARSAGGAAQGADALVIATDWPEFASLDYTRIRQVMRGAIMVDARSIVRADSLRELGFEFYSFTNVEHSNGSTENGSSVPGTVPTL
jgi:UDPglucose 6-dehydrogenase